MQQKLKYDIIIIGGGIIGLSVAYTYLNQRPGSKLLILEKENDIAKHQTGHNSGVIHSGIYYKPNSLKATNCSRGYFQLLQFCQENNINFNLTGKIIAARTDKEIEQLFFLKKRGEENGLKNLKILQSKDIKKKEPFLEVKKGLWIPQTGVINFKHVALALKHQIEQWGGVVKLDTEVSHVTLSGEVHLSSEHQVIVGEQVVTCVGVQSDRIIPELAKEIKMKIIPFRGEYYKVLPHKNHIIKGLIYPVPNLEFPFLGVHFTKGIDKSIEIGPNAILALAREGYKNKYAFNFKDTLTTLSYRGFYQLAKKHLGEGIKEVKRSFSKKSFLQEVNSFIPNLTSKDISYARSGIRAQVCDIDGNLLDDFSIIKKQNITFVLNAPSPGATSCLSIGEFIIKA